MSKSMWIISILILILLVSSFWFGKNRETPPWMKCKESLFEQVVLGKCSPSSFDTGPRIKSQEQNNNVEEELPFEAPQN